MAHERPKLVHKSPELACKSPKLALKSREIVEEKNAFQTSCIFSKLIHQGQIYNELEQFPFHNFQDCFHSFISFKQIDLETRGWNQIVEEKKSFPDIVYFLIIDSLGAKLY